MVAPRSSGRAPRPYLGPIQHEREKGTIMSKTLIRTTTRAGRIALSQAVPGFWSLAPRAGRLTADGALIRPRKGEESVWAMADDGRMFYAVASLETGEVLQAVEVAR